MNKSLRKCGKCKGMFVPATIKEGVVSYYSWKAWCFDCSPSPDPEKIASEAELITHFSIMKETAAKEKAEQKMKTKEAVRLRSIMRRQKQFKKSPDLREEVINNEPMTIEITPDINEEEEVIVEIPTPVKISNYIKPIITERKYPILAKQCRYCSRHFPATPEFFCIIKTDKKRNVKFGSYCKECLANKYPDPKEMALAYKGGSCQRCGYSKCHLALEFHHIDPAEKEIQISHLFKFDETMRKELDKCLLLCSNCHREEHSRQRTDAREKRKLKFESAAIRVEAISPVS